MRNAFASHLEILAAQDERIVLLSGDIGNRLFDGFKQKFPDRFFNCGVAEANMISMAAGMALSGLRPVAYTIASFITTRCFEQIRVDLCYQEAPVVVVGVGAGLSYAANGPTHHSCEDIAILRVLPNMAVTCPADPVETKLALQAALQHNGPVYLRLGKKGEPVIDPKLADFRLGEARIVREGKDVCLLSTGTILPLVLEAAAQLESLGLSTQVVNYHTVKPMDVSFLAEAFARFRLVVTVEEHSLLGGTGGSIAEWLVDQPPQPARLLRIGTQDVFLHQAGGQRFARGWHGLTASSIAERTHQAFGSCCLTRSDQGGIDFALAEKPATSCSDRC
jgi:transketolase